MARLSKTTDSQILVTDLKIADRFWPRLVGLLKHRSLNDNEAMWIHRCNWIHTFFMKFSIDCIFVDKNLCIVHIAHDVRPWRMAGPAFKASSVIEMPSGAAERKYLKIGEQLHVGD